MNNADDSYVIYLHCRTKEFLKAVQSRKQPLADEVPFTLNVELIKLKFEHSFAENLITALLMEKSRDFGGKTSALLKRAFRTKKPKVFGGKKGCDFEWSLALSQK